MTNLRFQTVAELAPKIKNKEVSPVELTDMFLNQIKKVDRELNTYITVTEDLAREQAKKAEAEILKGEYRGPLHGIPVGIKDNFKMKGIKTTAGAKILENYVPDETAATVDNLIKDGAVILGKQNMHELASGLSGYNPHFGKTLNPWNTDYIPGGSSNGGSVSLLAGLNTLATGTDTFGSIRTPASMSGVYGLKPTKGLSSTHGLIPGAWSTDTTGPMARSISDVALMLESMAGYVQADPSSLNIEVPKYYDNLNPDIKGMKIGIPTYYLSNLEAEMEKMFQQSVSKLEELGAQVKEVTIPELDLVRFAGLATLFSESAAYNYKDLASNPEDIGGDARATYLAGSLISGRQYARAQQARREIAEAYKRIFKEVDILVGPTSQVMTPKYQEDWVSQSAELLDRISPQTSPANIAGIPGLAVPMGRDTRGLPAGMIFFGDYLAEQKLLNAGLAWEQTKPLGISYEDIPYNKNKE